ncbi:F-box/LRR-repeat protein 13 [Setaria viridis]|uniref:F-box domain-containing protein n=1 Tax=Setaria viridis TaxID=4556 RepID=A0A4U6TQ52_SETVI|nr:F-box/FBD/LRR-repeat protein At1g13570-like [Setaria viridis]TKW03475.1 hypothetical protein SEVIR_7G026900v2 [Setaria viridis]
MAGQAAGTRTSRRSSAGRCPPSTAASSSTPTAAASTSSAASPASISGPTDRARDPHLDALISSALSTIHRALPSPSVSVGGRLCALPDAPDGGGPDRLSCLPDALLRDIISRLPVKDAVRTAALSHRWRPVWLSAPLVLYDAHLLPAPTDDIPSRVKRADSDAAAAAVSVILAAHGGPLRSAYLACGNMDGDRARVARWLQLLAVKGVEELLLINRPPLQIDKHLPATLFSMAALTRLYLCFLRFPATAGLPRGAAFPRLRELGLCSVAMEGHADMDFILARSPELENLCFEGHMFPPLGLRLAGRSLRCVQIHYSKVKSIAVVDAPRLARLIVMNSPLKAGGSCTIKIGNAPSLHLFGYFDPVSHVLQVGSTDIKAGTLVDARAMVPAVKILALKFHFRVRNDAKVLPSFLRCFPNVKRLYIHSEKVNEPTGKLNFKFWQEAGGIQCVESRVKQLVFHDFRGESSELAFLKFLVESARVLEKLVIVCADGCFGSVDEANSKVKKNLFAGKKGAGGCALLVLEGAKEKEGAPWPYDRGFDFSRVDPFEFVVPT